MIQSELKKIKLPDAPGVYMFRDANRKILYIGKATSLRDRVRSYFANDLLTTRGKHVVDMVVLAKTVTHKKTDSVLEALILEASLIKAYQPYFNTKEKDNKSFNYVVITKESFPRVHTIRERTMLSVAGESAGLYHSVFGPFPQGATLNEALKIIRRIFPFRDTCIPNSGKACFNRQIGLCPGVCTGEMTEKRYRERVRQIRLFFQGKRSLLIKDLERTMRTHARLLEFEEAGEYKRMIFALQHIKDVSLIKEEVREVSRRSSRVQGRTFRIEGYDIAHISGVHTVGVMTVVLDGQMKNSEYRKFKIHTDPEKRTVDDTLHLEEILRRRFTHHEWVFPDLIVIDGGVAQKRRAERVLTLLGVNIGIVSVVKDHRHKPKAILGNREIIESYRRGIQIANAEAHRFAVKYHRKLRDRVRPQ